MEANRGSFRSRGPQHKCFHRQRHVLAVICVSRRCGPYRTPSWPAGSLLAFRNIPVHTVDRLLLAICSGAREDVYLDKALPFGSLSAPQIFTAVHGRRHGMGDSSAGSDANLSLYIHRRFHHARKTSIPYRSGYIPIA